MLYFLIDTLSSVISSSNYFILSLASVDWMNNFFSQLCLMTYYSNLHTLLAAYSILYLKSSQDIINDVNNLEDLCRVSQFQKFTGRGSAQER